MSLEHLILWLSTFWALLYTFRRYRRRTHQISFLPAPTSSAPTTSPELFRTRETRVTLHNFHLNIQSTAWNAFHQYASSRLRGRTRFRALLLLVYDAGSALGVLGMFGSVLLLTWTTIYLGLSWYNNPVHPGKHEARSLYKRDIFATNPLVVSDPSPSAPLQLIIPGVTTPLHHLPILLIALLTTQIVHEVGHVVAAALDAVSLSSAGLGLTVILPSAFVAFSASETESLPPRHRVRIISAGAYHNLVFWAVLAVLAAVRISDLVWVVLGYQDVSAYGRVVLEVDKVSPLVGHIPVGAVVYKVGDDTLDGDKGAPDKWEALLSTKSESSTRALGWCAEEPWFAAHNSSCCTSPRAHIPSQACFSPTEEPIFERCLDPLHFFGSDEDAIVARCASAVDCGYGQLCIRPRRDQELTSLIMHIPYWLRASDDDLERTVVWQGDKAEILQEVEVGDWLPKYRVLPIRLPALCSTLYMYLKMLTLSLYFFNLLPLPFLDGGQLLDVLLEWREPSSAEESIVLGDLEGDGDAPRARTQSSGSSSRASARRETWRTGVHASVGTLMGSCLILSLMNVHL